MKEAAHAIRAADLEDDHAARRRPLPQGLEGIVHTLERQAGRDHLVEAEETPPVELEVARHVDAEAVRAHHAAEDRLLAEHEVRARQLDVRARRHDADHDDRAALARHAHRLADRRRQPDRLEGVVAAVISTTRGTAFPSAAFTTIEESGGLGKDYF